MKNIQILLVVRHNLEQRLWTLIKFILCERKVDQCTSVRLYFIYYRSTDLGLSKELIYFESTSFLFKT